MTQICSPEEVSLYGGSFSHMILYYQGEKYRSLCLGLHTVYKGSEGLLNPGVESRFYCVGLEVWWPWPLVTADLTPLVTSAIHVLLRLRNTPVSFDWKFKSFFILGKDYDKERKDRKRKNSYHESESDVYEVKKRKQESPPESSKVQSQITMTHFIDRNSDNSGKSGKGTTSTTVDSGLTLTVDTTIEVYQYGHTKKSGFRNTLFVLSDKHRDLSFMKKSLRKEYGVATDAKRYQIGDFSIEIGVTCSDKAYMANTQTEWQNLMTRFNSGTGQCCLLGK